MKIKQRQALKELLESKYLSYHRADFIDDDPISIPHLFSHKEDIEIAGFFAATIAWGQRKTILKNAKKIIHFMDNAPYDFILNHSASDLKRTNQFVHRTFNHLDLNYFFQALQLIYRNKNSLEDAFTSSNTSTMDNRIADFKSLFFSFPHLVRTEKHIANPLKGSTAKRINMFLRWMVRDSKGEVDFGIWKKISPKELMMPLDVHTGNVSRMLGLLKRKQNDWKTVVELTEVLKQFDPDDPVKYDYALFGMGVNADLNF